MYKGFFDSCSSVALSMGAEGKLAVITTNEFSPPISTKDGVSISRAIFYKNKFKNIGAYFSKQAAAKTLAVVGDATTTTLVFAMALVKATRKKKEYFFNSKVREGIQTAQKEVEEHLKSLSKSAGEEEIHAIAKISANGSERIAELVKEAYTAVGKDGSIGVQQNPDSSITTLKLSKGMMLDRGWKSPFLINKETNASWEADQVNILVYEGNIQTSNANSIAEFIQTKQDEPILIVCEHISDDVILNIVDNFQRKILNICVIESPFYAEQRKAILQDIALYAGTEPFVQGTTENLKFGKASKVIVDQNSTSIIVEDISEAVTDRIENLKSQLSTTSEKDFFRKRIAALEGKAAIIMVGDVTEGATKEQYDRVEDSVAAVKAALQEGIISGGGSALVYIAAQMKTQFKDADVQFGYEVVKKALEAPYRTILSNARVNASEFIEQSRKTYGTGYNVKTDQVEDLNKSGVVDSVKSGRVALENAVSVGNLILNTKVIC